MFILPTLNKRGTFPKNIFFNLACIRDLSIGLIRKLLCSLFMAVQCSIVFYRGTFKTPLTLCKLPTVLLGTVSCMWHFTSMSRNCMHFLDVSEFEARMWVWADITKLPHQRLKHLTSHWHRQRCLPLDILNNPALLPDAVVCQV